MAILNTLAGGFGPHHGSLQMAKSCTHRHHTVTVQWEESIRWMPHPPSAHRRSLCPSANYILVNRTFNHYASNPDGPIQTPSILPVLASIQTQVQGPYTDWMSLPFQSLQESEHCSRWASFLLMTVAFQNPYPLHNTALPLSVVTHIISHILHCDNSSGFYQGYLDQMELSFMLTLLLHLAQTDTTHLWGLTPPATKSRDLPWLLSTAAQSLLGPLYRPHLQLSSPGPTNSEELLDDEDLFWDCLSKSDLSFTDPTTTRDGGEEPPPILPPADSPAAQLRPTEHQHHPASPNPDTTSQFPNPEPVASLHRPATPQQTQAPRVNPTGLTRWLNWIPRSELEGPHSSSQL
jgi:hypothetical protein